MSLLIIYALLSTAFTNHHQFAEGKYNITLDNECGVETGILDISNVTPDHFTYSIKVSNWETLQGSEISGKAEIDNKGIAKGNVLWDDGTAQEITSLTFSLNNSGDTINVVGYKTYIWHGAGICFNGQYDKVY